MTVAFGRRAGGLVAAAWLIASVSLGWALSPQQAAVALDKVWADSKLGGAEVAVLVADCLSGQVLYGRSPSASLIPASNEKLPVTAAALLLLGPDHRFRTAVYAGGEITQQGFIEGPLMVVGSADPTCADDIFASMAAELRQRGITGCRSVWVSGPVTAARHDDGNVSRQKAIQALVEAGIRVDGTPGVLDASAPRIPLIEHLSEPLGQIVMNINKRSLNSWADKLWCSLALAVAGSPQAMPAFMRDFWALRGLDTSGVQFADGSGLSRRNRATPAFYVSLLRYMYFCAPEWPAFVASLPVAGVDGTLAKRMTDGLARGRVWAKTGTMHDIATLSGYATTLRGNLLVFSILMNDLSCSREAARALQDEACQIIVQIEPRPAVYGG